MTAAFAATPPSPGPVLGTRPVRSSGSRPAAALSTRFDELIAVAVTGDARARADLLAEIHPLVLRYCRARLGRQETASVSADDVAQDICLGVLHALPTYTISGRSFRAFVYGIAAHKVTDTYRAIGRNRSESMADVPDRPVIDDGPEQALLSGELTDQVARLLGVLTSRQREVLVLRVAVGLSAEETAATVGSTPGAVRVTQHRALTRVRRALLGFDARVAPGR